MPLPTRPTSSPCKAIEAAGKNLTLNATSANDPTAAAPVIQAAVTAEQAAENLRNSFLPDPSGSMDKTSFALLEAPIQSAKNLAAQAPANAAGGGAKAFCAQIAPVLAKFPFNPQSSTEASTDEVAQVFAPDPDSFAQFYNASLRALVVQQGSQYVPAPGSAVHINSVVPRIPIQRPEDLFHPLFRRRKPAFARLHLQ